MLTRWLRKTAARSGVQVPKRNKEKGLQMGLRFPAAREHVSPCWLKQKQLEQTWGCAPLASLGEEGCLFPLPALMRSKKADARPNSRVS